MLSRPGQDIERPALHTSVATLDALLDEHRAAIGKDFSPYRNHTYRVFNFCARLTALHGDQLEKVAIAAALHDIGIWTAGTFDYLAPSVTIARKHLESRRRPEWAAEIEAMILNHHRITPAPQQGNWLVDPFRRADWVDVSMGLLTFRLSRTFITSVFRQWPTRGFHRRLVQLSLGRARSHPWNPLPMVRL